MGLDIQNQTRLKKMDYTLVIIALILGPFTQLRIARIGISELAMVFFVISILFRKNININFTKSSTFVFTKFWIVFLFLSFLGLGYNAIFLGFSSGRTNLVILDTIAYIMAALVCFTMELLIYNSKYNIYFVLRKVFYMSSLLFLGLFIISRFTSSIMGYTLLQYQSFRPLATNIHHAAMSLAPLPFLGLIVITSEKNKYSKRLAFALLLSNIYIALHIASTKLLMGLIVGALILVYFFLINKFSTKYQRILIFIITLLLLSFIVIIYSNQLTEYAMMFFETEDVGGARESLWISSINRIMDSPLFGYGPGPHALLYGNLFFDAHQSLLTVGLQGGILAMLMYSSLLIKIVIITSRNELALASLMGIITYAFGGDILRRLPMWIFLILLYYYSQNKSTVNSNKRR